jgi:hypothetical protein
VCVAAVSRDHRLSTAETIDYIYYIIYRTAETIDYIYYIIYRTAETIDYQLQRP